MMRRIVAAWLALGLLGGTVGCSMTPVAPPVESAALPLPVEPSSSPNFRFGQAERIPDRT